MELLFENIVTKEPVYMFQGELERMESKMPGCHQGGLALYKLMVEAERNCDD